MTGFNLTLLLAMAAAAVFTLAGVYLGLRWNMQVRRGEIPSLALPRLLDPFAVPHERPGGKEEASVLDEWLNGEK